MRTRSVDRRIVVSGATIVALVASGAGAPATAQTRKDGVESTADVLCTSRPAATLSSSTPIGAPTFRTVGIDVIGDLRTTRPRAGATIGTLFVSSERSGTARFPLRVSRSYRGGSTRVLRAEPATVILRPGHRRFLSVYRLSEVSAVSISLRSNGVLRRKGSHPTVATTVYRAGAASVSFRQDTRCR